MFGMFKCFVCAHIWFLVELEVRFRSGNLLRKFSGRQAKLHRSMAYHHRAEQVHKILPDRNRLVTLAPMKALLLAAVLSLALLVAPSVRAADAEWSAEANMDHQLFPSLLISTASVRPVEEDDEEAEAPDPSLLGDRFGLVGISIHSPAAHTKVKVTLKKNDLMDESIWTGELPDANQDY